jgi:hypothetical protein
MNSRRWIGAGMLAVGLPLVIAQFVVTFTQPLESLLEQGRGFISITLHISPFVLILIAAYLLFPTGRTPGLQRRPVRILLALLASWGTAGGILLAVLVLGFFVTGASGVERIVVCMPIALIIASVSLFPILYPRLR